MSAARRRQPERAIQSQVVSLLRSVGCQVYVLGTTRRAGDYHGTMQSPGLPDLIAFLPRGMGVLFCEAKAPGGRLRPEQAAFRDAALACGAGGVAHVVGGVDAVLTHLAARGLVRAENVPIYRRLDYE